MSFNFRYVSINVSTKYSEALCISASESGNSNWDQMAF